MNNKQNVFSEGKRSKSPSSGYFDLAPKYPPPPPPKTGPPHHGRYADKTSLIKMSIPQQQT